MKKWDIEYMRSQMCTVQVEAATHDDARRHLIGDKESTLEWTTDNVWPENIYEICPDCNKRMRQNVLLDDEHCCAKAVEKYQEAKRQRLLDDIERAKAHLALFESSVVEAVEHGD